MTNQEITGITIQGARYLQAGQQDMDLNLRLTHLNYAVAYFETVMRYATPADITKLTGIDISQAMDNATALQNAVNLEYMRRLGIQIRVPFAKRW